MKPKLKLLLTLTALASCEQNLKLDYAVKPLCETICLRYVTCGYIPALLNFPCNDLCIMKMLLHEDQPNFMSYRYENEEMKQVSCEALQKKYGMYNKTK
jgi:hypothetical protein